MRGLSFTKWDSRPETLEDALEGLQECYRQAITPPCGPALIVIDAELQKQEAGDLQVPAYQPPTIKGISNRQAARLADDLLAAKNPHVSVGRMRTPAGIEGATALAELIGASVSSRAWIEPMSFPQSHPLCGAGASKDYDFVLGLETSGAQASIIGPHRRTNRGRDETGIGYGSIRKPPTPIVGPYAPPKPGDNDMTGDAEISLPHVIGELWNQGIVQSFDGYSNTELCCKQTPAGRARQPGTHTRSASGRYQGVQRGQRHVPAPAGSDRAKMH